MKISVSRVKDFVGHWRITELSELDQSYFDESDERPFISIHASAHERVYGDYHFGLSHGHWDAQVRECGSEAVLLFGYEGSDEMDSVNGAGWAQVETQDRLVGEFLGTHGKFSAKRKQIPPKRQDVHTVVKRK